jgi:hypothetical protein
MVPPLALEIGFLLKYPCLFGTKEFSFLITGSIGSLVENVDLSRRLMTKRIIKYRNQLVGNA